jgi:hypothetical protein
VLILVEFSVLDNLKETSEQTLQEGLKLNMGNLVALVSGGVVTLTSHQDPLDTVGG